MEELVDILNEETGERTGKTVLKSIAHNKGIWHGAIHILIVSKDCKKTLLQKRCADKKLYSNTWDIAVGGHIGTGENAIISAQRELKEELGIDVKINELKYFKTVKEMLQNNGVISNEFDSIYVLYSNIKIENIKLQKEEVSEIKWVTLSELNEIIEKNNIIPHKEEFIILNNIMKH